MQNSKTDVIDDQQWLEIDWRRLNEKTLRNLVREEVIKEGTDYGENEIPIEDQKQDLLAKIKNHEVLILFDQKKESIFLRNRDL